MTTGSAAGVSPASLPVASGGMTAGAASGAGPMPGPTAVADPGVGAGAGPGSSPSSVPLAGMPTPADGGPMPGTDRRLRLALVLHAHQPPGNRREVVERLIERSYRPVLGVLARHRQIPVTMHWSGSLLRWVHQLAPDLVERLGELVQRGQVELLGSAMHHPLLPLVGSADRRGQLSAHRRLLAEWFGVAPLGAWCPERAWEPHLVQDLAASGATYTVLDDAVFVSTGVALDAVNGPFLTEQEGQTLTVFAAARYWRYQVPFTPPEQVIDQLLAFAVDAGGEMPLAVYADDFEKFGGWPGTEGTVAADGWLDRFCRLLAEVPGRLILTRLDAAARELRPRGCLGLPAAAYPEFMQWALAPAARPRAHAAGHPRGFLSRYPEARLDYRRQQVASRVVHQLPDPPALILDQLWQGQTDAPGWFGWFPGIYAPWLRQHAKAATAAAEREARRILGLAADGPESLDLDLDGENELLWRVGEATFIVDPGDDGTLLGWEAPGIDRDLVAVMTPWPETEPPRPGAPTRPWRAAREWWFPATGWMCADLEPTGALRLPPLVYTPLVVDAGRGGGTGLNLTGRRWLPGMAGDEWLSVEKRYRFDKHGEGFWLQMSLTNNGRQPWHGRHGLSFGFTLAGMRPGMPTDLSYPDVGLVGLDAEVSGEITGVRRLVVREHGGPSVGVATDRPVTFWHFPVAADLEVEGTPGRWLQGVGVLLVMPFSLEPGANCTWSVAVTAFADVDA